MADDEKYEKWLDDFCKVQPGDSELTLRAR